MRRQSSIVVYAATSILIVSSIAGCSPSSPEENEADACASSAAYEQTLSNLNDVLPPDSTVEEVRTARDESNAAYDDMREAARDVAQDRLEDLSQARENLRSAVDDLPEDTTLAEGADAIRTQVEEVQQAKASVDEELGC